eukprot:TRINITY_DN2429_c0_g1_i1.p1 TRINITY_DN2429_c0_g1~~TRINITY_DN2429_c0_g1_i1.p1  ORF type:complete len:360 (-),score=41.65 TRINITY_DN2429_c0_g1_i1:55-1134(-)
MLPAVPQLLAQYCRAKRRSLLLHECLTDSFFGLLNGKVLVLEIGETSEMRSTADNCFAACDDQKTITAGGLGSVQLEFSPPYLTPHSSQMTALVSKSWRVCEGLSHSDVVCGFCAVKCFRPGTSEEVSCPQCQGQRGLGLVCVMPKGASTVDAAGREAFLFRVSAACSSSRLHMGCSHVFLQFQLKHLAVLSAPVQIRSRLRPSDRAVPLRREALGRATLPKDEQLLVLAPRFYTLPTSTPLCIVVRVIRNHSCLSSSEWRDMLLRGLGKYHTHHPDTEPLTFRSVVIPSNNACHILAGRTAAAAQEPQHWWFVVNVSCYPSYDASEFSKEVAREMLSGFGVDEHDNPVSQILSVFSNW